MDSDKKGIAGIKISPVPMVFHLPFGREKICILEVFEENMKFLGDTSKLTYFIHFLKILKSLFNNIYQTYDHTPFHNDSVNIALASTLQ